MIWKVTYKKPHSKKEHTATVTADRDRQAINLVKLTSDQNIKVIKCEGVQN